MNDSRPLSPHLSIHKKVLTALFSITHRITGIGLSAGSILIFVWFLLICLGPNYYLYFELISKNILFKLILIIWTIFFIIYLMDVENSIGRLELAWILKLFTIQVMLFYF